jgi:WD40 repeat protein
MLKASSILSFVIIVATCALPTTATDIQRRFRLLADDATAGDGYGDSVAVSGNIVIIGANDDDDQGDMSGSAYLVDVATGDQLFKLTASDGAVSRQFGLSSDIDGNTAVVGTLSAGGVYVFDTTTGTQLRKIVASDGSGFDERFGYTVALSGSLVAVGAHFDSPSGNRSGSAFLFDAQTGTQLHKFIPNDGDALDEFGTSVAVDGNTVIVGAPWADPLANASGAAYLFNATTGAQIAKLIPTDGTANDRFGTSVDIHGNFAVVGAERAEFNGRESGAAYVFDVSTGTQIRKLLRDPSDLAFDFGYDSGIHGNLAVVGAFGDSTLGPQSGAAFIFDVTTGEQIAKLLPDSGDIEGRFGTSVGISAESIIVGSDQSDIAGNVAGSAYLFAIVPEPGSTVLLLSAALFACFTIRVRLVYVAGAHSVS